MAKKMSKRKQRSIVLGVALTLAFVLLGGCITALVTETNPADWFMKTGYTAPEYSEWGKEPVKEYKKLYLNTTDEGVEQLEALFDEMATQGIVEYEFVCIGETKMPDNSDEFSSGWTLSATVSDVEDVNGNNVTVRALILQQYAGPTIVLYSSEAFAGTNYQEPFEKGFQNLGENGLIICEDEPISGSVVKGDFYNDVDFEDYSILSIYPVK